MRFKGWFGRKAVGYGVGPRSWQGWLVSAVAIAALLAHRWFEPQQFGLRHGPGRHRPSRSAWRSCW